MSIHGGQAAQLVCPSCGTTVATVLLPAGALAPRSTGGPRELVVRAWLAEGDWSGLVSAADLRDRFRAWAALNNVAAVSDKALSMGLLAAGCVRERRRDGTYFRR